MQFIYFGIWYFLFLICFSFSKSLSSSSGRCVTLSSLNTAKFSQLNSKYEQKVSLIHLQISWFYYLAHPFIRTFSFHHAHLAQIQMYLLMVKMPRFDRSNDKVINEVAFSWWRWWSCALPRDGSKVQLILRADVTNCMSPSRDKCLNNPWVVFPSVFLPLLLLHLHLYLAINAAAAHMFNWFAFAWLLLALCLLI